MITAAAASVRALYDEQGWPKSLEHFAPASDRQLLIASLEWRVSYVVGELLQVGWPKVAWRVMTHNIWKNPSTTVAWIGGPAASLVWKYLTEALHQSGVRHSVVRFPSPQGLEKLLVWFQRLYGFRPAIRWSRRYNLRSAHVDAPWRSLHLAGDPLGAWFHRWIQDGIPTSAPELGEDEIQAWLESEHAEVRQAALFALSRAPQVQPSPGSAANVKTE